MNSKGQINLGAIIGIFMTVIIGLAFVITIAESVGESTNTVALVNQTETLGANGDSIYIEEYKSITSFVLLNASNNLTIGAGNYTVTNNALDPTTGALSVQVQTDDTEFQSLEVRVSGTAQPRTYISDSGGRAIASLIVIMFALGLAIVALTPTMQSRILDMMGK